MTALINQVLTLAIIMGVGVILAKVKILNMEVRQQMSKMLVMVVAPMYIIKSFQIDYSADIVNGLILEAVVATFAIGLGIALGLFIWRKQPERRKKVLVYATGLMNTAFIGYPLIESIFGPEALVFAAVYTMIFNIYLFTAGVWIFTGKSDKWYEPLKHPGFIGILLGLFFFIFNIKLPHFLLNALGTIGSMTGPMAMLIIGAFLSETHPLHALKDKHTYIISFFRLVVMPAIVFGLLTLFDLPRNIPFACAVLLSGMPAATNTVLFATTYDGDSNYAASVVAISTILGLITIPIWVLIMNIS